MIYNLEKMRQDNIEEKLIDFAQKNSYRIQQPEQDTLNLVCYPKVKELPKNSMVCSYVYDLYKTEADFNNDKVYTPEELKFVMENPIQLHYATSTKPWSNPACTKADLWFRYLCKTPFAEDYFALYSDSSFVKKHFVKNHKTLFHIDFPLFKRRISLIKEKI